MVLHLAILSMVCLTASPASAEQDWPSVVLQLKAKEGQNFEQDLALAKAYLQLERRTDALRTLRRWWNSRQQDEALQKQLDLTAHIFFQQETSNLYFEAVRLASVRSWGEAKEKLEQALKREPANILVLSRLAQVEVQLSQRGLALERVKQGLELHPNPRELRVIAARLDLDQEETRSALRHLTSQKSWIFDHELPTLWYFEALHQAKRSSEVLTQQRALLKKHATWLDLRYWLLRQGLLYKDQVLPVRKEIESGLSNLEGLDQKKETEYRVGHYFWVSAMTLEQFKNEFALWVGP